MTLLTIARGINVRRQLGHRDLEARLDLVQHVLVGLGRDERDRETLRAETTRTSADTPSGAAIAGAGV